MPWSGLSRAAALAAALVGTAAQADEDDPARAALRAMSHWLAAQPTLAIAFDSAIEVITPEIEKLQFASSGTTLLARPYRLRARRESGHAAVEMAFDGSALTIVDLRGGGHATIDAPGTVDDLFALLHAGHGVSMPGADLLLSAPYEALIEGVTEAKYLGASVIGGRLCDHLAFREDEVDWQIWIESGDRPAPCRMIVTTKTMTAAPAYTLTVTSLRTDVAIAADAFVLTPKEGSPTLDPEALIHLDELPEPAR